MTTPKQAAARKADADEQDPITLITPEAAPEVATAAAPVTDRLAGWVEQARQIILSRQDPGTGLLPASTAITVHGDYTHAWVRDNVYSILAIWALELAHRERDQALSIELRERVEALMRGLLAAMLKQAHKVERFKHTQHPLDALHAKYATTTGDPVVGDAEWGHLQIDATAIFLLQLAQMSASGLSIVREPHEVAFVQNLVHYLARAHRTPDYGIWERGHKQNQGRAEINASSVGMAKAALEAIADADLLPGRAPRILVQGDDIAHARSTLAALLPRESESKETDAALLSVIGYPAFAVDDPALIEATRERILAKLQGRYGCKRFLRDGHQTVVEDHSRLHYEQGELQRFRRIESEWPLFFTYLLIDTSLREDEAGAADYRQRLDALMVAPVAVPVLGDVLRYTVSPVFGWLNMPLLKLAMFAPSRVTDRFKAEYSNAMALRPSQIRATAEDGTLMVPGATGLRARITVAPGKSCSKRRMLSTSAPRQP